MAAAALPRWAAKRRASAALWQAMAAKVMEKAMTSARASGGGKATSTAIPQQPTLSSTRLVPMGQPFAKLKQGQAPRGWLEREAQKLMTQMENH